MITTFIQSSSSIRQAFSTLEYWSNQFMCFISLEFFIRIKIRIFIVQPNYKTNMHKIGIHVIHKTTSIDISRQWPINSMLNCACLEMWIIFIYSPYFLQTDTIMLHSCGMLVKFKLFHDLLSDRAPTTFSKNCLLCINLYACLVSIFMRAIFSDTKISSNNTPNTTVRIIVYFITSNTWQNINSE